MADATTTIAELRARVQRFVHEREWEQFHLPKDLAIAISIESSELLERFLWRESTRAATMHREDRAAVADELADVVIYSLSLADVLQVDVSDTILAKLKKDEAKYPADRFRGRAR